MLYCRRYKCKHYYEDNCMLIYNKDKYVSGMIIIDVDEEGNAKCTKFEKGKHEGYGMWLERKIIKC